MNSHGWWYISFYTLLIIFFAYFYTAIAFNPQQQADIIRKQGGFIPGIRPGPPTERYLAKVLNRITLPGSLFLADDRHHAAAGVRALGHQAVPVRRHRVADHGRRRAGDDEADRQPAHDAELRRVPGLIVMSTPGPRLVLLGKQGAGKGTQAARLAEHYGVAHLSTGDLFRASAAAGTPLGLEAKGYIDRGELVPDDDRHRGRRRALRHGRAARRRLRPRRLPAHAAPGRGARAASLADRPPRRSCIDLDVPTEVVLDRIAGRRVCEDCGANYHVNMPPKDDWTCDMCGGDVVQRDDDTEEAVSRRLELYEKQTVPIIDFYQRLGKLVDRRRRGRRRRSVQAPRRRDRPSASLPRARVITRKTPGPDRPDAPGGQGGRGDARGVHPRGRSRARPRSTSTARPVT